jgi:hypothetical protein
LFMGNVMWDVWCLSFLTLSWSSLKRSKYETRMTWQLKYSVWCFTFFPPPLNLLFHIMIWYA